jgi:hypothetical protein
MACLFHREALIEKSSGLRISLVKAVNGWQTTAGKLRKWCREDLKHCQGNETCSAPSLETADGLEVSMSGERDRRAEEFHLFGIEVKQGGKQWTVMHRYNDFKALKEKLGLEADSLPGAPFPSKFWSPFPSESKLAERRKGLEKWLQQVLQHPKGMDSWKQPLMDFLHQEAIIVTCHKDHIIKFAKTSTDRIEEWYREGLKHCQKNDRCKAAKQRYENMVQGIGGRMDRLRESVDELKALAENIDRTEKDLENLKAADAVVGAPNGAIRAAEEKHEQAMQSFANKFEEVHNLDEDTMKLVEAARASDGEEIGNTMAKTEF